MALIFRVTPPKDVSFDKLSQETSKNIGDFCQVPWVKQGNLEILFLKRAFNPQDQWGGHVGLPGGKKRGIESDFSVAQRETLEEVGLTLEDRTQFLFLGRLNDRATTPRVPLIVSTFVFVQLLPMPIPLKLDCREVHSARWISWSYLYQKFVTKNFVPLEMGMNYSYPSLFLPQENETLASHTNPNESYSNNTYRLWGITLDIVQDCFDLVEYGFMKVHSYL